MNGGFSLYDLTSSTWSTSIPNGNGDPARTPMRFIHGNCALLRGSSHGCCHIWSLQSYGQARLLQTLRTGRELCWSYSKAAKMLMYICAVNSRIISIATYEASDALAQSPARFIATGIWDDGGFPEIVIWEAIREIHDHCKLLRLCVR